jgi:hypothetical protein
MYLVDLGDVVRQSGDLLSFSADLSQMAARIYDEMAPQETFWVFSPSESMAKEHWPTGMVAAEAFREETPFTLKNVITRYSESQDVRTNGLVNVYEEILFIVKDLREYYFDKDAIRIQHVYEGNEWLDRETGRSSYHNYDVKRYNPKGKDPGNVWLNEIRTESSDETVDRLEPLSREEALLRCIRAGSQEEERVTVLGFEKEEIELIEMENRVPHLRSISDYTEVQDA